MNGHEAESLVKESLGFAGIKVAKLPTPAKLMAIATRIAPNRVARCLEALDEEGIDLMSMSSWDILDHVYGLDVVFIHPTTREVVGVDVTLHPTSSQRYYEKMTRLERFAPLHHAAGVTRALVFNPLEESIQSLLAK